MANIASVANLASVRATGVATVRARCLLFRPLIADTVTIMNEGHGGTFHDDQTLPPPRDDGGRDRATIRPSPSEVDDDLTIAAPSADGDGAVPSRIGPYRTVRLIGAGGMGSVYEAIDERLGRRVALKAIRGPLRFDANARARFLREARVLSSIEHPSITRLYDYVEDRAGAFLVLEYVDGTPLGLAGRTMSRGARLRVAQQIAEALVAAHAAGIVHRDLKPDNVMVNAEGDARVLDFGIARPVRDTTPTDAGHDAADATVLDDVSPSPLVTAVGAVIGTPVFMSPEQAAGRSATPASDMYAFGLLLQELMTGEHAVERGGTVTELLERMGRGERRVPRGIGRECARLIADLTQRQPERRPTASDVVGRVARLRGRPVRRAVFAAVIVILALTIAGAVKYTVDLAHEQRVAIDARTDAESLVAFMTTELGETLRRVGRLDALDGVAERVIEYYGSRGLDGLTDDEVHQYVRGLLLMAEVQLTRRDSDPESALHALEDAGRLAEALVDRSPESGDALKSLVHVHYWKGNIDFRRGHIAAAAQHFEASRDIALRLVALDGENPTWLQQLGHALNNLMFTSLRTGDQASARRFLDESIEVKRRTLALDAANPSYRQDLANSLNTLSEATEFSGELTVARAALDESIRLLAEASDASPDDTSVRYRLAVSHVKLGEFNERRDQPREALASFRAAQDAARELLRVDPSNAQWQREYAIMHRAAARAALSADPTSAPTIESAARELEAACRILAELVDREPTNVGWRVDLARTLVAAAAIGDDDSSERSAIALRKASDQFVAAVDLSEAGSLRDGHLIESATAIERLAVVHQRLGDAEAEDAARLEALDRLNLIEGAAHAGARAVAMLRILLDLRRFDEAAVLLAETDALGLAVPDVLRDRIVAARPADN